MKKDILKISFLLLLLFSSVTLAQISYSGPLAGSIPGGVTVSTNSFSKVAEIINPKERATRNIFKFVEEPFLIDYGYSGSKEPLVVGDLSGTEFRGAGEQTILLNDFQGIPQTNSIPPDPYVTVGPNHIMATVNSSFAIWDKEGNLLKTINADSWYSSVLPGVGSFDPKVFYDHHDQRWVMVWLHQSDATQTAFFLISVSDDADPIGTWYNWALPSTLNGTNPSASWGDYQGVGFDKDAMYITSNQFSFSNQFQYVKLRIIGKDQLYQNTAGSVTWTDIWNISRPGGGQLFTLRPAIVYGEPSAYYLAYLVNGTGNTVSIYTLTNPLTAPVLTGVNIGISTYQAAPQASQLGGSTIPVEGGGSSLRHEPIFRDGMMWMVHSVRNPNSAGHSAIQYLKVNAANSTLVEDYTYGAVGYWHIYSHLAVDEDHNVAITFSRSGDNEYIGAYYTTRLANDPPGFERTFLLKPGNGNYVKDFGSGRNRWGDYNGIWLDPADQNNFWLFTEYVAATNTWGTWVGKVRLVPFAGIYVHKSTDSLNFGNVEKTFTSDTLSFIVSNYGTDVLTISAIPDSVGTFKLISDLTFPINLNSYDSLTIDFAFNPLTPGVYEEFYPITSNDPSLTGISLKGKGYEINEALGMIIYASTGVQNSGEIAIIDEASGIGSLVGSSLFNDMKSLTINPADNKMYGLSTNASSSRLVRINATLGDAYTLYEIPMGDLAGIAFDTTGNFYLAARSGEIYDYELSDGTYTLQTTSPIQLSSIAFERSSNELFAAIFLAVGAEKDRIYKIDLSTGDTVRVGRTGLNVVTNAIVFDDQNNFYGVTGSAAQINNFIEIDPVTGVGTIIGPTGFKHITGLAFTETGLTDVEDQDNNLIPTDFSLEQNYPNPFNPATTIEFSIPKAADVKVVIYNLLGEEVNVLINRQMNAGVHKTTWNSNNNSGKSLSSGVYFYELRANSNDGTEFKEIRKMVLLK